MKNSCLILTNATDRKLYFQTKHKLCLTKMMKDECLGCLFKMKGAKHKTLDLSRSYILTTPKFI